MNRRGTCLAMVLGLVLLLSGCLFRSPDELYRRPAKSPGYDQLTAAIQNVRAELELEYSTICEDGVIVSGDNTASIQLQDLDGDEVRESAVVFLRVPGVEKAMKVFLFSQTPEGEYKVSGLVEGDGSAIYSVDYADLNGMGLKELVISWQISAGVYQLGAYTLDELGVDRVPEDSAVQTRPDGDTFRATEMLLTGFSAASGSSSSYARGYILLDIDQDTRKEVAVARLDPAGITSEVEVYGWRDGAFVSLDRVGLSAGAVSLNRMRDNYLSGAFMTPAIYVTCILDDGTRATDVLAYQRGEDRRRSLTNLALDAQTGVSRNLLPANMDMAPTHINDDMVLELPKIRPLPTYDETEASRGNNFWLIDWGQYTEEGEYVQVMTTYHNSADGWYLIIPDSWIGNLTISRNDTLSGQRQVDFSLWHGESEPPETFLSIYQLTGSNRMIRAASGGRFTLREEGETIYAARFYDIGWDCGLTQESLTDAFRLIQTGWYN